MKKVLSIVAIAALIVGVMVGGVWAGQLDAGNTTVAAEKIPAAAPYTMNTNTSYQVDSTVAASTVLQISLTNGTFAAPGSIDIYDPLAGALMGCTNVVVDPSTVELTLPSNLATGIAYIITDAAAAPYTLGVNVPGGSLDGTVVTLTVDNKNNPGDTKIYAQGTVVTVKNQVTAKINAVTSKLDFATMMKTFKFGALTSSADLYVYSDESLNDKAFTLGVGPYPILGPIGLNIRLSGDLHGLASISYDAGAVTTAITPTDITNGYVDMAIPAGSVEMGPNGQAWTAPVDLTLTAIGTTGTDSIATGDRTVKVELPTAGPVAAGPRDLISAGTVSHTFELDASQYYIPLIGVNSATGRETYIKIQSKSQYSGSNGVVAQILCDDGSMVSYDAGTVSSGTPLTITGSQLKAAATAAGKTVGDSFAVILTVNAPESDLFIYANIIDPSGAKRVPVKTVGGLIVE